jgi:succinate dehydrogenase/fumarate reductase flavoprotein subunit
VTAWDADVIVAGSGGAGLAAALASSAAGARVLVLERTARFGGTTATSAGIVWVPPGNDRSGARAAAGTSEQALAYLRAVAGPAADEAVLASFAAYAARAVDFLWAEGVRLRATAIADSYPALAGAGSGRSFIPEPFAHAALGAWAPALRRPACPLPYPGGPGEEWFGGAALAGALLAACLRRGVRVLTGHRVCSLVFDAERMAGVAGNGPDGAFQARAPAVILATGGFEWDTRLREAFLPDLIEAQWSAPWNEGDGLRMAQSAGAEVGGAGTAWWYPLLRTRYDDLQEGGRPVYRDASPARNYPGSLVVDRDGRRFADEGQNYHDFVRAFHQPGPAGESRRPAWLVFDRAFLERYGQAAFGTAAPGIRWCHSGAEPEDLAAELAMKPGTLRTTIDRFNAFADALDDADFGRGSSAADLAWGDPALDGPARTLAALRARPLYATRIYAGTSGTTVGPRTDASGRVRAAAGGVIAGLYAAGNVAAAVTGGGNVGAGGTIGPALTFGWLAGQAATR